jgi:hypothetical protein
MITTVHINSTTGNILSPAACSQSPRSRMQAWAKTTSPGWVDVLTDLQPCIGAPQKPSEFGLPDLDCLADKIAAIEFPAGQTRSDALALDQPAIARKIEDRVHCSIRNMSQVQFPCSGGGDCRARPRLAGSMDFQGSVVLDESELAELFMKELTHDLVVPTISARSNSLLVVREVGIDRRADGERPFDRTPR